MGHRKRKKKELKAINSTFEQKMANALIEN